jgi:hypothetical protein
MSPSAKNEYLATMSQRYHVAGSRAEKTKILDEICATCGFHRKHAIRVLSKAQSRFLVSGSRSRRGRKPNYADVEFLRPLKKIWLAANLPCAKRLKAMVPLWLPGYEALFGALQTEVRQKLLAISASSIDRLLKRARLEHTRHGRSTTKPGTLLRNKIPINTSQWQETRPGFVEADTVAHCGTSMAGEFAFTLDCVDIATGWSEQRAVWAKHDAAVVKQMRSIEKTLPFPLLGFDSDNGSEFINHQLFRHFVDRQKPVKFTRSRAYHKDDNAHVEQKNWTHVRQWLGYERFDNTAVIPLLNDLYTTQWRLYHNFYCPSVKLLSKERIGSKTVKKYDSPKTPYQRVMESEAVSEYAKNGLQKIYDQTNPFILWRGMQTKLKRILKTCYRNPMSHDPPSSLGNINCDATINSTPSLR